MTEERRYVIGVDGGGTKTHALLVALDGSVVAESTGGPTNLSNVGVPHAAQVLFDLIHECCQKIEIPSSSLHNIVLGLAGAGRQQLRTELSDTLLDLGNKRKFPLKHITVETDARIALEAAFAGGPGIVVIGGTGSIALYRTEDKQIVRAGGWGKVLGDEGGGYAIAKDALNAVMRQHDGRGEKTLLSKKALEHFSVANPDELILKISQNNLSIADFAPKVFDATNERDRTAHLILVKNSNELVELVRVLSMQIRPKRKLPVSLMGGLLESENVYSKMVREKIVGSLPQVLIQKPKFPAAFGAAILGLNAFR